MYFISVLTHRVTYITIPSSVGLAPLLDGIGILFSILLSVFIHEVIHLVVHKKFNSLKFTILSIISISFIIANILISISHALEIEDLVKRKYGDFQHSQTGFDVYSLFSNSLGGKRELIPIQASQVYRIIDRPPPSPCTKNCFSFIPGDYHIDIQNNSAKEFKLYYDIYSSSSSSLKKKPVILHFHGGGWKHGSRRFFSTNYRGGLAHLFVEELDFMVISFSYRLTKDGWNGEDIMEDIQYAIDFTRANCEKFGCDKDNIVLFGTSAGAHLALNVALERNFNDHHQTKSYLKGVIALYPPTDIRRSQAAITNLDSIFRYFLEVMTEPLCSHFTKSTKEWIKCFENLSPVFHAERSIQKFGDSIHFPPTILIHGHADGLVSSLNSKLLFDILNLDQSDLHLLVEPPTGNHDCDVRTSSPCSQISVYVLRRFLNKIIIKS